MSRRLFVGNLSFETSEADLKELFATAGTCASVAVIRDRSTGRPRGFAFVEMGSDEEAQQAVTKLNGAELGGRNLNVSEARERGAGSPRPSGPSRFSGQPRSFGYDAPPAGGQRFRKEGGSRRGLRARKRSL